jgi:hypothetical protein
MAGRPPRIGSRPAQPKQSDPETEQVRGTLKNPFAKHYGKDRGAEQR